MTGDQVMIEEIKSILDDNLDITPEVKNDLFELILLFNSKFNDVNLDNLKERLKTLKIRRESMYLVKMPCKYMPYTNEILINLGLFAESDARHWLMHSLLGVITGNDNHYGFNDNDDSFLALNEGYTEIIVNNLVGDIDNNFFTDEIVMTNLISKVIGENTLYSAYFNNGAQLIRRSIESVEA